jgi:ATP-dependent RNA helicase DDX35
MKYENSSKTNYKLENKVKKADLDDTIEIMTSFRSEKNIYLPIEGYSKELIYTIENSNITVVIGETGCGKTTKIPEFLYKSSFYDKEKNTYSNYKIAHILPRKVATITVAQRVAKNMNLTLGKEVGYSVRFDYNYSKDTQIKFLTEGMFIRELLIDPLFQNYNCIIIDDCHERTINSELIFGFLKKIFVKRKDLKIIISSATLDYQCYLDFFNKSDGFISNIFLITGRNYPVEISYLEKPINNYIEASVITAMNIHKYNDRNSGDILVFLTGQEDINLFLEIAGRYNLERKGDLLILPLCAGLPITRQLEVFSPTPHNKRKIVISTNIAEASVTIDNIAYVIDSCLVKMKFYNSQTDTDGLFVIPASKFSLDQRSGRAGRTRPGHCYRLITDEMYTSLYKMTNPELLRSNLREYVLRLKSMGVRDLYKFKTITEPERSTISRALESLFFLGVIDKSCELTDLGKKVCDVPIDIRLAVALFKSAELKFNCTEDVLIIAVMLSIQNLFYQPKDPVNLFKAKQKLGVIQGDHLTLLNIYKNYKSCKTGKSKFCKDIYLNENLIKSVEELIHNLKPYLKKHDIHIKSSLDQDGEDILKSLLKGFFLNVAQKQIDGSYRSLKGNLILHIHPTSVLYNVTPEFIMFHEVVSTAKNYIKEVSLIDKKWILEVAEHFYEDKTKKDLINRHKEEVKIQMTQVVTGKSEDKRSISKIIDKQEELFKGNFTTVGFRKSMITNKSEKSSRLYMDIDKNKDLSHYFENSDNEDNSKDRKIKNENSNNLRENTSGSQYVNDDDIDEITMLRRMRKRK